MKGATPALTTLPSDLTLCPEWDPKLWRTQSQRGAKGGQGAQSPTAGGLGDVPSDLTPWPPSLRGKGENWRRQGRERANPVTSGAQNSENPKPTRVGKWGWRGPQPPPRGLGGCAPKN